MSLNKYIFLLLVLSSLAPPACDSKQENPVGTYLGARKSARDAADTANLYAIRQSVQAYHAANGSYPASLRDIEGTLGSPMDLSKYDYDPQTGAVTLKTQE